MPEALNTNNSTKRTTVTGYINYKYLKNALAEIQYLCFARMYLSLIPVSNLVKDNKNTVHLCVKHKLINCHGMWFNWVADVPVYVFLICHINNNDPAKLW